MSRTTFFSFSGRNFHSLVPVRVLHLLFPGEGPVVQAVGRLVEVSPAKLGGGHGLHGAHAQ